MIRALADAALVRGREEVERPQVAVAVRVVVPHVQRVQVRTVREHAAHFGSPPFASSTNYSRGVVAAIVWPYPSASSFAWPACAPARQLRPTPPTLGWLLKLPAESKTICVQRLRASSSEPCTSCFGGATSFDATGSRCL